MPISLVIRYLSFFFWFFLLMKDTLAFNWIIPEAAQSSATKKQWTNETKKMVASTNGASGYARNCTPVSNYSGSLTAGCNLPMKELSLRMCHCLQITQNGWLSASEGNWMSVWHNGLYKKPLVLQWTRDARFPANIWRDQDNPEEEKYRFHVW